MANKKIKEFGTKDSGVVLTVDEGKMTKDFIKQVRNYLTALEKKFK